jgi:hypothetical protein
MTDKRYDPAGAAEIWQARLDTATSGFMDRTMTEAVFRATLYQLGFRGSRLAEEFRYWDHARHDMSRNRRNRSGG